TGVRRSLGICQAPVVGDLIGALLVLHRECPVLRLGLAAIVTYSGEPHEPSHGRARSDPRVDTHLDVHVAVLIDVIGRVVATHSVETTSSGYDELIEWAHSFGRLIRAGVEGTGTYGAALARRLRERDVMVLEINRPDRSRRRLRGK